MGKAGLVAAGILVSRLAGLVRIRVFAHYFGLRSDSADAFNAAFRVPNFLQNLFGEGALSGSFIPVYAGLLSTARREEADRVASAVGAILSLIVAVIVVAGVLTTPALVALVAPGFTGAKRELTVAVARILFPGTGLLVWSAWCLGILNSHHKFLLSYIAPVMWNAAMITTLAVFGARVETPRLAVLLAWGSVAGSALQFGVQVPVVMRLAHVRPVWDVTSAHVRTVAVNFVPVLIGRGIGQLSAYIDTVLASLLPTGAVTGLMNAQLIYTLPISLFGISIAAAELPAMSGAAAADPSGTNVVKQRLLAALRQVAFLVVPSSMAFLAFGDVIAAALLQTGRFSASDARYVWGILAGSAVGLLAATLGRLYSSTYYALRDTRTPLRFAIVRVTLTTVLGYLFAIPLPRMLGLPASWGTAGLTISAGLSAWVEMLLLRHQMNERLGWTGLPSTYVITLWMSALAGAALGWVVRLTLPVLPPYVIAAIVLAVYGLTYLGATLAIRLPEARALYQRVARFR
jgi:putative peptidoglycan lipid II flippase